MTNAIKVNTSNRIVIFDYLKALAIILVIVNHYVHLSWESFGNCILFPLIFKMPVPIFMIVTGCMNAMSYNKKYTRLSEMYMPKQILVRFLRFWIPFLFEFVVEMILTITLKRVSFTPLSVVQAFLVGGPGLNGSYYVPVLIQFSLLFPLIYVLVRKYNVKGLIICMAVNLLYEVVCTLINIPSDVYRLLMPRYIAYVALGCWFYFKDYKISKKTCYIMFAAGAAFFIVRFCGYRPFIFKKWTDTCMLAAFYIFPIVAALIMKFKDLKSASGKVGRLVQTVGNASYHIFLIQMLYYNIFYRYITKQFNIPAVNIPLNIVLCVSVGIVFYYIEKGVSKRIINSL